VIVLAKIKYGSLVVCLFLFLFVVIGGGLHLNPAGAFLAAASGTPLVIHAFNRWIANWVREHLPSPLTNSSAHRRVSESHGNAASEFENEDLMRR
jgi:hypothetical protein